MKDINKVILIGRLGNDPEKRETKNGLAVTHFSLATSRRLSDETIAASQDGKKEETQWHRIVAWGKQAENISLYLKKGASVYVEGSMRTRTYVAKDGAPKSLFEVHAENVSFLSSPKKHAPAEVSAEAEALSA